MVRRGSFQPPAVSRRSPVQRHCAGAQGASLEPARSVPGHGGMVCGTSALSRDFSLCFEAPSDNTSWLARKSRFHLVQNPGDRQALPDGAIQSQRGF